MLEAHAPIGIGGRLLDVEISVNDRGEPNNLRSHAVPFIHEISF